MATSKSTYYLPSQIKTGMSSATRDPEVKRLGDPDWDFSGPRSLTGRPVTCSVQLAADRMKDTKGVTAIKVCYKVSLCENCQQQCCKAFIGLTNRAKIIGGGRPLVPEILDQSDRVGVKSPNFYIFSLVAPQP